MKTLLLFLLINTSLAYREGFHEKKGYAISGWNTKILENSSVEKCKAACLSETSFFCKSCEFESDFKKCFLSEKNQNDEKVKLVKN